ncbi:pilus assembly protein PilP [Halomonas sp.]|uniref:pilus assembly protein PilP n=1 Tax=Halomonas sp. TaxID=1486246 RepID=UPI000C8A1723|nr:pilus assembly protein PilP [Halomonas sp.]MAR74487.1 hypothetical protein [Halomonas sp.]|tara:strand:+ start:1302 stop:1793 length:492 start_codon:yes stop_codon:yes gene_type:complete
MKRRRFLGLLVGALFVAILAGCQQADLDTLDRRLAEALAPELDRRPVALPEVVTLPVLHYRYASARSPFRFEGQGFDGQQFGQGGGLASFSLDELDLVGVLGRGPRHWALFETPDGHLYRVAEGGVLASPPARVAAITVEAVRLEAVAGKDYRWKERVMRVGE